MSVRVRPPVLKFMKTLLFTAFFLRLWASALVEFIRMIFDIKRHREFVIAREGKRIWEKRLPLKKKCGNL